MVFSHDRMLRKYQRNPPVLQHVSKYFYSENVYDDDSTDQPKPRWRFRSTYGELFSSHRMDSDDSSSKKTHLENTDPRNTNLDRKQVNVSTPLLPFYITLKKIKGYLGPGGFSVCART